MCFDCRARPGQADVNLDLSGRVCVCAPVLNAKRTFCGFIIHSEIEKTSDKNQKDEYV